MKMRMTAIATTTTRTMSSLSSPQLSARRLPHGKALLQSAVLLACGASLAPRPASAQARITTRPSVEGHVINSAKVPVVGAVVYLENPKSLNVQSYLTDDKGYFHFSHIAPQTDYNVWAEQNGIETKHKFISQFSSHTHFHFTLKLTPEKKKKFLGIF